jgi:Cdc6-like AAA superfamily ATPase
MTTHAAPPRTGDVLVRKGFEFDRSVSGDERDNVLSRILLLPAWFDQQLEAANLDVRRLEGADGFYRLRVGDVRAVFQRLGADVVIHRIGRRADIYEGLEALVLVRSGPGLRVLVPRQREGAPAVTERRPPLRRSATLAVVQNPLTPFADRQLHDIGLPPAAVDVVRRIPPGLFPEDALAPLVVEPRVLRLVAEMWERPAAFLDLVDRGLDVEEELLRLEEEEAAERVRAQLSRTSLLSVRDLIAFGALLERDIEDWMVYLHPSQGRAVDFSPDAPARVRGAAGTGKTVVALHRARALAEDAANPVLLTTFVKSLPKVWGGLFGTFAPEVRERLDLRTVDSVGYSIYREGGGTRQPIEDGKRRTIVEGLHAEYGGRLGGLSTGQLQEEIAVVLEGREVATMEGYLELPRTGRGSRLPRDARRAVWEVYERFRERLEKERLIGWDAMRAEALRMLRENRVTRDYAAVVVDEAQDLSEASMRLLIELAGGLPRPRLTIVGDGQQSIYPGGFSLRSLGVDVRGRSIVLRTNWRNTYWIWSAAQAFIAGEEFDDLEDEDASLRDEAETPYPLRYGEPPRLHLVDGGETGEAEAVALLVAEDVAAGRDPGDCVVLHPMRRGIDKVIAKLKVLDVPVGRLENYEGEHAGTVWVGTFHRAKGLEFKHVYVVGLSDGRWPMLFRDLDDAGRAEERARQVRAAFVALTRARDTLDVVCGGRVPAELERARDYFDE